MTMLDYELEDALKVFIMNNILKIFFFLFKIKVFNCYVIRVSLTRIFIIFRKNLENCNLTKKLTIC